MRKIGPVVWSFAIPLLLVVAFAASAQVQRTQEVGIGAARNSEVLVTNAAGGSYVPGGATSSPLANRRAVALQNLGPNPIYCTLDGQAPLSTGALGYRVLPGETWAPSVASVAIRCISTAAQLTTAATQVIEVK